MLTYRVVAVGLPLLTVGIITGAMWANEAWGAYWQWDPKETAALALVDRLRGVHALAHAQRVARRASARGSASSASSTIMFCYLGVNIWISGLHWYKT